MIYYIIIAMLICLTYLEWSGKDNNILGDKNMEKYCYVFMATLLTLIAALLYQSDPDWQAYTEYFKNCFFADAVLFEPGYILLNKIFSATFGNYYVMQFVIAVFYNFVIFNYIYKKSEKPIYTTLLYFLLSYFWFIMTAQRNAIAIAIVVLGMKYVEQRRLLPWLFTILLAMQFHITAIVAIPLYFTTNYTISKRFAVYVLLLTIIIELFSYPLIVGLVQQIPRLTWLPNLFLTKVNIYLASVVYGQKAQYGTGLGIIAKYSFIFLIAFLYNPRKDLYMTNFVIAVICMSIGRNFPILWRLNLYYTFAGCGIVMYNALDRITLPTWATISKESRNAMCYALLTSYIFVLLVLFLHGINIPDCWGKTPKDYHMYYKWSIFQE